MTEDSTNDVTVYDPFTGSQKLYAPDPDPSLPTKRLPIEVNPLSKPSVAQSLPLDVVKYNLVEHNELSAKLQEHIKKQHGLFHENPTVISRFDGHQEIMEIIIDCPLSVVQPHIPCDPIESTFGAVPEPTTTSGRAIVQAGGSACTFLRCRSGRRISGIL